MKQNLPLDKPSNFFPQLEGFRDYAVLCVIIAHW
jgi:hypothetical protein